MRGTAWRDPRRMGLTAAHGRLPRRVHGFCCGARIGRSTASQTGRLPLAVVGYFAGRAEAGGREAVRPYESTKAAAGG